MSVQEAAVFDPIQANDIDAELERSLTHEWDAQIMTYPNERFPFNEWIRDRIRRLRALRRAMTDAQAVRAIDELIYEAEQRVMALDAVKPDPSS